MPLASPQTPTNQGSQPFDEIVKANAAMGPFKALGPILAADKSKAQLADERAAREAKDGVTDYMGAAFRQDSPIDGLVATYVGSQFKPDPSFNVYDDANWKNLTAGVPEDFHKELTGATSLAHAEFIKSRLLDKVNDMTKLGDLGFSGEVGRFALGMVDPANLALGPVAGRFANLLRGSKSVAASRAAVRGAESLGTLEAGVKNVATAAAREGSAKAVAGGIALAGVGGAAFEKVRQSVNFEDSNTDALIAGLFGMAFGTPFALIDSRSMRKIRNKALSDLELLSAVKRANEEGVPPPPHVVAHAESIVDLPAMMERVREYEAAAAAGKAVDDPAAKAVVETRAAEVAADKLELDNAKLTGKPIEAEVSRPRDQLPPPAEEPKPTIIPDTPVVEETAATPVREAPLDPVGQDVWWPAKDGEVNYGQVIQVNKNGTLLVEHADTGKKHVIDPESLATDSPLYREPPDEAGFLAGSVGSAQVKGVSVEKTAFSDWRFDIYAKLNKSDNPEVRNLADLFIKDAIAKSDTYAQYTTASEDKKNYIRTVAGVFHLEQQYAAREAAEKLRIAAWRKPAFYRHFDELTGRLVRGDDSVLAANPEIAGELSKGAANARKLYDKMLKEMQDHGVKGADNIAPNDNYVNRVWDMEKAYSLIRDLGDNGKKVVIDLLASAMKFDHPSKPREKVAAQFFDALAKLEHSRASNEMLFHARDEITLRKELQSQGLTEGQIDSMIHALFEKEATTDTGVAPNLKFRFKLDENASVEVNGRTIRVSDLLENNIRVLVDRYMNSMAGHVAMAKKGIRSRADFEARLRAADADHETNAVNRKGGQYADEKQWLKDLYDNIVGRPMSMQTFNEWDRIGATVRGFTRAATLGQLGFTAALEIPSALGLMTARAFWMQMPSFRKIVNAARSGKAFDSSFAQDVLAMTGFGTEGAASHQRVHQVTEYTYDKALTRMENASNTASHAIDVMSGNRLMTAMSRHMAARVMMQKYVNFATGHTKLDDGWMNRLVANGIDRDNIPHILEQLKTYAEVEPTALGQKVNSIKWEEWSAKDPESYHSFVGAINREVRTAIQDHDIGETPWFIHSTMGKYFSELKTFALVAYSKKFLAGFHFRDQHTAATWAYSFATQALGYIVQTSMNYAQNQEELEKRLTMPMIAKAVFSRMSETGIPSIIADFVGTSIHPSLALTGQGLTANTDNRSAFLPPSATVLAKGMSGVQGVSSAVLGGQNFTGKDFKNLMAPLPGSNLFGSRNVIDWVSSGLPKTELRMTPN